MEITTANALKALMLAVLETIRDAGDEGCPSGPLYAAMMTVGLTLNQYEQIVDGLLRLQVIRRSGHVLYAIK